MKIIHCEHSIEVDFEYGEISNIIIENPRVLHEFILDLNNARYKRDEKIYILDNFEKIDFTKLADLIFSPLELTYEKKEVQKK